MFKAVTAVLMAIALLAFLSGVGLTQQAKPEHPTPAEHPKAAPAKPEHPTAAPAKPDKPKADPAKPEHPTAAPAMPDKPKSEHPK